MGALALQSHYRCTIEKRCCAGAGRVFPAILARCGGRLAPRRTNGGSLQRRSAPRRDRRRISKRTPGPSQTHGQAVQRMHDSSEHRWSSPSHTQKDDLHKLAVAAKMGGPDASAGVRKPMKAGAGAALARVMVELVRQDHSRHHHAPHWNARSTKYDCGR